MECGCASSEAVRLEEQMACISRALCRADGDRPRSCLSSEADGASSRWKVMDAGVFRLAICCLLRWK